MSENATNPAKRRPDYLAFAVVPQAGSGPRYTRIGVGFTYKNGSIGIMYDAVPLRGQIVLLGIDDEKPGAISYDAPTRKPDFEASMVREAGPNNSFWTDVGVGYRREGYLSVFCDVVPTGGKIVLSAPRENN
jgi:hypothetical protein